MTQSGSPIELIPRDTSTHLAVLAFDYGTQRIGVAFGQSLTGTARGVKILKARDGIPDWEEIACLIAEWQPDAFVVGLPFNMDGTESELLKRAIKFANRLNGRFNLPCYGMDERLTSREARQMHAESGGKSQTATAIDDLAAGIILENWFSEWRRDA